MKKNATHAKTLKAKTRSISLSSLPHIATQIKIYLHIRRIEYVRTKISLFCFWSSRNKTKETNKTKKQDECINKNY